MVKDMTQGKPSKLLLTFALPLLAGNVFQQLYNIIDSVIVGKYLGAMELAAVGVSSSVQFLILGFCNGASAGMGIPIAQRFGAGDYKKMRDYIFHGAIISALVALLVTTFCGIYCPQILHLLKTSDNLYANAYDYLFVLFMGIPFTILYNYTATILRSVGDSKTPFIFLGISTVLNIGLDCLCIMVLKLGCMGAALATITAQAISGILCMIVIIKKFEVLHLTKDNLIFHWRDFGTMIVMGIPMGLQFSITAIGSMALQSANNGLENDIFVSGFTAANRLKTLFMCPFDAIATAVATFSSQNLGAGKFKRIHKGIFQGTAIAVLYGAIAGVILIFFGGPLTRLFIKKEEVETIATAAYYLRRVGYFYFFLGFLNTLRMTIQGIGYALPAIGAGVLEMIARCVVAFAFVPVFEFAAVSYADPCAWIAATLYVIPLLILLLRHQEKKIGEHEFSA